MFILTDGKNYVMENPMSKSGYISTTYPVKATAFSYKQARALIQNNRKATAWIREYYMVDKDSGEKKTVSKFSNNGIYKDGNEIDFDYGVVEDIKSEITSIIGLAAWDYNQLSSYKSMLNQGLSYYDSAISDVRHARLDKRPPAHICTKVDGIVNDLEEKRRDIKQVQNYIFILLQAIDEQWTIGKIKASLSAAKYVPYKGRTKYFDIVENLVKSY